MGRVHQIIVENFKSYAGRQEIGPFRNFTCIVGPNGAGKSNLMDAISFVLGVQARALRSERVRDLVYRREGEDPKKNQRSATVELTYASDDGALTLVFKRMIQRGGETRFYVNDQQLSQADYHKKLESINILSKVRNFLVFQGDVEAVAARQGKDLTAFFEQISGSDAYKAEYEQLAAEKTGREDNARHLFQKKRNALNEKRRVSLQKDEADEYRRVEAERDGLQREFYLFRLHGISQQLDEVSRNRAKAMNARDNAQSAVQRRQHALDAADRERAQAHLAAQQADRAFVTAKQKLDKLNPERVAARSRFNFLQERIADLKETKNKDESKHGKLSAQLQMLRAEQEKLEAEESELNGRIAQCEAKFSDEQQQEFDRVRKETERVTAATSDSVRQLEHQLRGHVQERTHAENDQREYAARRTFLESRLAELREALAAATAAHAKDNACAGEKAGELSKLRGATVNRAEEKEQLQVERQQLADTIQDATATERQLEREHESNKVCTALARAVPGVHGRVVDLCRPAQKRLHVAVNVALGKYLDAVVVDSAETARNCVRYLKERMLAPMSFLPLSDLRTATIDPRLGEIVSGERTARLALNCVTFDDQVARAFEFVLGGVVVTDTMADGRRLAFGEMRNQGLKCRVVTLAGEAIAKNGNLSVNSDATREGATRFDLSELDNSKKRIDAIDRRLRELHQKESSVGAEIAALQGEVRRAETKAGEAKVKLNWYQEQLGEKSAEHAKVSEALKLLNPACKKLADDEARLRGEQRDLEKKVSDMVKSHFAELSKAMGVKDVQKLERESRHEKETAQSRKDSLLRQLRNVRAERTMMEQTLNEKNSHQLCEELLPKLQQELAEANRKENELSKGGDKLAEELKTLEEKVRVCSDTERNKEKALQNLRNEAKEHRQELVEAERRLSDMDSAQHSLSDSRTDLLRQSVLDDVEVPLLRGGQEALQDLAAAPSQAVGAPTQAGGEAAEVAATLAVDFSSLPEEKQQASVGPAAKLLEDEYRAELDRLKVEMRRLSPNLKAIEQIQGVAENVQSASKEADVARREIEDIETRFERVRTARRDKFNDCFTKVANEIGNVYKRLTSNTAGLHSDGGVAYLDLEDADDPFLGGIKFTAMPPAKRLRFMDELSGGEKTLAAMALLFAVHAYQRPPFMVLDEVDAALDANNVRALAGYVEQAECQTIVISLKDRFFVRGDALVGVYKDKPAETSAILTLDLTKYLQAPVN